VRYRFSDKANACAVALIAVELRGLEQDLPFLFNRSKRRKKRQNEPSTNPHPRTQAPTVQAGEQTPPARAATRITGQSTLGIDKLPPATLAMFALSARPCFPSPLASQPLELTTVKLLIDLLPVIAFFAVFKLGKTFPEATASLVTTLFGTVAAATQLPDLVPIILATAVAIVATALQIAWLFLRKQEIKPMLWISAALIIGFGGLTIWLQNEWFIKWKPSLLYWSFAVILLGGQWLFRRNLLGALLGSELKLPERVWNNLLYCWAAFFAALGTANILVAYHSTTEQWVDFKTFGLLGLTLAFSLATGLYMAKHMQEAPNA
jgi:intracellular septation protein